MRQKTVQASENIAMPTQARYHIESSYCKNLVRSFLHVCWPSPSDLEVGGAGPRAVAAKRFLGGNSVGIGL